MKDHYNFAKNLSMVLKTLGINNAELSRMTGLTPAAVSQILSGKRVPSLHTVVKILDFIPVKFETLIKRFK